MDQLRVPVLIIGGGGCGLSASVFLSNLGVEHLLVERHASTSHLPKAHYLNQRTMEVFRQHGLAEAVREVGTPQHLMGKVRWRTSLGGDKPLDAKTFYEMDAFGGGSLTPGYAKDSPEGSSNYPQLRLEPLLRSHAEERGPGRLRFNHEVVSLEQDETGVTAVVHDRGTGSSFEVRAEFVIAADGGRFVANALGVALAGPSGLLDMVSVHFSADLAEWVDESCLITWFANPDGAGSWGSGAMVPMGPTWGAGSEEWVVHFTFGPDDPERFDEEAIVPRLRALLKLPDLGVEVHKVSHWILEGVLAERYQVGRVFLAGDAAHRHPPTTGLGLNTAFQDAHNLAWKLALVVAGQADRSLLDSYEAERQPIGMRNVDWAMFTFLNHLVIDAGLGLMPGQPPEAHAAAFEALFAETPMGATRRARAAEVIETQRTEFQAHDLEIGFSYQAGAVVPDGSDPPWVDPMGCAYLPTTRPGHRLPHAWLFDGDRSERLSTHDLAARDQFVVISGPSGPGWVDAATQVAEKFGVPVRSVVVGACGLSDTDGRWAEVREIGDDGAVLVRPDNHVCYRSMTGVADATHALANALGSILGR